MSKTEEKLNLQPNTMFVKCDCGLMMSIIYGLPCICPNCNIDIYKTKWIIEYENSIKNFIKRAK